MAAVLAAFLLFQPDAASLVPLYEQALAAKTKELGPGHPSVARLARDFGLFQKKRGQREAAVLLLRQALAIDEKVHGAGSRQAAEDQEELAALVEGPEAIQLLRQAAQSKDDVIAARNLARLGSFEERRGDRAGALELYRSALMKEEAGSGKNHPRVAIRLNDVALLLEPPQAEPLLRRAQTVQETALGPAHPELAVTLNNLANVLLATNRIARAEPLARRALVILENSLGPNHPRVATSASNLADILQAKRDFLAARRLYERALEIDERHYGPQHPEVAVDLENLARLLDAMGRPAEAVPLRRRATAIR